MVQGAAAWPVRHDVQLAFVMLVLQPLLLSLTLVDFARAWPDAADSFLMRALAHVSRILRPGVGRDAPATGAALLREAALSLQGMYITQAWFCARMASWHSVSEAYESGASRKDAQKQAHSVGQQLERLVMTTFAFPLLWAAALAVLVLLGAPVNGSYMGTAVLAAYVALIVLFPVVHILGAPPSPMWTRVLAAPSLATPREVLVLVPAVCAALGTLAGAAGVALDWGRVWQTWPLPCVYGAVGGVVVGNVLALGIVVVRALAAALATVPADQEPGAHGATAARASGVAPNRRARRKAKAQT
ncbi:hypothetical protein MBRA1_001073 [Malassezia brasiliensis]|uniref:Uncharacterized protein n=1 Tax=Malassezia brasiliensis TaxID=1821822 RepID=A0AAF0IS00_9BASI|nr:hypothetical protein MBRA1_001073 [Malassezia brasiliensis]